MNPFERIEEMKEILKTEAKTNKENGITLNDTITYRDHYMRILNMLNMLAEEMKDAEYNYVVESLKSDIQVLGDYTVAQQHLDNVVIFQPIHSTELTQSDMTSLANILQQMYDSNIIKENILLLPPDIRVFKARLANTSDLEDDNKE